MMSDNPLENCDDCKRDMNAARVSAKVRGYTEYQYQIECPHCYQWQMRPTPAALEKWPGNWKTKGAHSGDLR
jgi:hypothetical protein